MDSVASQSETDETPDRELSRMSSDQPEPGPDNRFSALGQIEKQTGVKKRYIALGAIAAVASVVFFGTGVRLFADFFSAIYPVYKTFKTIKNPTELAINEMLTYWVVWGVFSTTESLSDRLFSWFPIYYFLKFILLMWCLLPGSQGSATIYNYVLKPIFMKHHKRIDSGLQHTHHQFSRTLDRMFFKRLLSKENGRVKSGGTPKDEKRRKLSKPIQVGEYKTY
mmetsp:Transcript_25497/g.47560  ORF Transcript_25497/g.47560 Transcript_25497/m.47560 type:complete len:223 (-) Transcript_25497:126-794(-)